MLDQLLGSRCLQPNAVFVSAIYSTIYMKNGKVVYQITRESLNVVLLSPSSALFKSPPSPPMRFSPQSPKNHEWDYEMGNLLYGTPYPTLGTFFSEMCGIAWTSR